MNNLKPFLKWAGGKRQIIQAIDDRLPPDFKKGQFDCYLEPFVGGGAVLFHIANHYKVKKIIINDLNPRLILTYKALQQNSAEVIECLEELQSRYWQSSSEGQRIIYYDIRDRFNAYSQINPLEINKQAIEIATWFIFLNRTCYNGLFRVNNQGGFNVPIGRYENPIICDKTNLKAVGNFLQDVEIKWGDFKGCRAPQSLKSFIYFDPPYEPIKETSHVAYTRKGFDRYAQTRLADFCKELEAKGNVNFLMSNSLTNFIEIVYGGYTIDEIRANRNINSNGKNRKTVPEVLIYNYQS